MSHLKYGVVQLFPQIQIIGKMVLICAIGLTTETVEVGDREKLGWGLAIVHPLTPLSAEEIKMSSSLIRSNHLNTEELVFISISILEPTKAQMLKFSKTRSEDSEIEEKLELFGPPRKSFSVFYEMKTGKPYEAIVNLKTTQVSFRSLPPAVQPPIGTYDDELAMQISKQDSAVIAKLKSLGFSNSDNIQFDTWPLGLELESDKGKRTLAVYFYFKEFKTDNFYAHPLNFIAVVDLIEQKVLRIEDLPIYGNSSTVPPDKNLLPRKTANYDPVILAAENKDFYRKDARPLRTSTTGPSFKLNGYEVSWQKFKFRYGFNQREGLVIYDVSYHDGRRKRPLIYRAAMSEVAVAYGEPHAPYQLKTVLDEGELLLGTTSDSQRVNAQCFKDGVRIDAVLTSPDGSPFKRRNAICIHVQDGGLLQKHTVDGRVTAARAQILEIFFSSTLDNYDYIFGWKFHQDATISYEVGLTGLVSTNLFLGKYSQFGTIVSPGVIAQNHQHIFNVRIDTAFDGEENTVSTVDIVPAPDSDNPTGLGFTTKETVLKTSTEAVTDANLETDRVWKISNPKSFNPITKEPVAWKLITMNTQSLLAKPESLSTKRVQFGKHAVWVTAYRDYELYAAGKYPVLTESTGGLPKYVKRNEPIVGRDIVLWHSFGVTHIPRLEDYPLMAVEKTGFTIKPCNFFTSNPGLDVPPIPTK